MKIASWNINSLRRRQDRLVTWLHETSPDVVCLQETKCRDDQFPVLVLQAAGYHAAYHGEKSYNGVAILSKSPLIDVRASLCDEIDDQQARVIAGTAGSVRVYSIYAPNGQAVGSPAYEYKIRWYARLRDCLAREETKRSLSRGISMWRQRMRTYMIRSFGGERSCARRANERPCAV